MELMIVVCVVILLSCLALPAVARARAQTHETLCIHNLQRIEHAKALWYAEVGRSPEERPHAEELMGFFQSGQLPRCPEGGEYDLSSMEEVCACSLDREGHRLEPEPRKNPKNGPVEAWNRRAGRATLPAAK